MQMFANSAEFLFKVSMGGGAMRVTFLNLSIGNCRNKKMHNFLFENDIVRILGWRKQMMWQQHDASNSETDTQMHNFRFEVGRNSMQNEEISKLTRYYASSHETFVNNWNQINNLMLPSNKWIDDYVKAHNTTHTHWSVGVNIKLQLGNLKCLAFLIIVSWTNWLFCNKEMKKEIVFTFSCEDWFMLNYELRFREVSARAETKPVDHSNESKIL